jgi:hypothetical protein
MAEFEQVLLGVLNPDKVCESGLTVTAVLLTRPIRPTAH